MFRNRVSQSLSLITLTIFCSVHTGCTNKYAAFEFLIGTWKQAGENHYECWEKQADGSLKGMSYTLEGSEKVISEELSLTSYDGKFILEATVFDQNAGETVQFTFNEQEKEWCSFENYEHDFPNKIQYKLLTPKKIRVAVSGDKKDGFSFTQVLQ